MAQQESYPSPTAAVDNGVSPYQQNHQDSGPEHLDLNAQMQSPQHHDVHPSMANYAGAAVTAQMSQPPTYGFPAPVTTPYQGQIPGISGPTPQTPDESARKKSKVTRACDECRRKKIKCDAESDAPGAAKCSNCQRTQAECKFSRQPQKRGPSKGYIKELSDRVAQLEGVRGGFEESPVLASLGSGSDRKRTFSMTYDGYDQGSPFPPRPEFKTFAPVPVPEAQMHVSTQKGKSLGIVLATNEEQNQYPMQPLHEAEDRHMQDFTGKVNRIVPLLGSRDGINANLAFCNPPLRKAFHYSMGAVVGTLVSTSGELTRNQCMNEVMDLMRQGGLLDEASESGDWNKRPYQANLVYLQTVLMCVMYYQSSGPIQPDPFGTFTCHQLLDQARRMVEFLQLRHVTETGHLGSGPDVNRVFASIRRAFWVFIVLDIWNSIGTRQSRMVPYFEGGMEILSASQDKGVVNNDTFTEFVRRSSAAGDMSDHLRTIRSKSSAVRDAGFLARNTLWLAFGDGQWQSPEGSSASFATLAYGTAKLLAQMLSAGPVPCPATADIVEAACHNAALLGAVELPDGGVPLVQHFVVPTVKALLRAADYPYTRTKAVGGLQNIQMSLNQRGILDASPWYGPVTQAIAEKINDERSMRSLANAAAGEMGGEEAINNVDAADPNYQWPEIVVQGYLNGPL